MNINSNKLIQDYNALLAEKEQALAEQLQNADALIQERITSLIPEIESSVKGEIENSVREHYADRIAFYEQYISIVETKVEQPKVEQPEVEIISPAPSIVQQTEQPKFSSRPKFPFMGR